MKDAQLVEQIEKTRTKYRLFWWGGGVSLVMVMCTKLWAFGLGLILPKRVVGLCVLVGLPALLVGAFVCGWLAKKYGIQHKELAIELWAREHQGV